MAIEIDLYYFPKKVNSTARPTEDTAKNTYNGILKEPCGILNPIISFNLGLNTSPASNYAFIPSFDRYYFVKEWTFQSGLWIASLEVDALASWKLTIGASTCYILRCAADWNGKIQDTTYPGTRITTLEESIGTTPWTTDDIINGRFVVGIAGQNTTYYLFSYNGLQIFFDYLFGLNYADDVVDGWLSVFPQLKAQLNPLQFITQILWIPFYTSGTPVSTIRVGYADVPVAADKIDGSGLRYGQSDFILRRHPQEATRGTYLNNAPYSNYMLFYPPWGTIPLDADVCANVDRISAIWGVDLRTGQGTLSIVGGNDGEATHLMSWIHSQVGLHYQVSQVINSGYGLANCLALGAGIAASAASGNVAGTITGAVNGIGDIAGSQIPHATTIGSNGGLNALRGLPALQYEFKEVVDSDNTHRGRPLCENRQISTLPGYIKVANAYINIAATQTERDSINSYMEGGFFYE